MTELELSISGSSLIGPKALYSLSFLLLVEETSSGYIVVQAPVHKWSRCDSYQANHKKYAKSESEHTTFRGAEREFPTVAMV